MENKKEKLIKAKTMVVTQGATLKKASKKTGLTIDTLKKFSSKEKWIELQEEFFKELTFKMIQQRGERHLKNRLKAFDDLEKIYNHVIEETEEEPDGKKIKIYGEIADILKKCIMGQAELLGTLNIRDLYIEQAKIRENKETEESHDRVLNIRVIDGLTNKAYNEEGEEIGESEEE